MDRRPLPPVAVVVSFVDCINHADLDTLAALLAPDHRLEVLDERPVVGHDANVDAWRGYLTSFPSYVIHPRHLAVAGDRVAIVGATTGSHLDLPDEEELQISVLWIAEVSDGLVRRWAVRDDTPAERAMLELPTEP